MRDRRKNILNFSERKTAILLRKIADGYNCAVNEKVCIADAVEVNETNLTQKEFSYALKAHFDFVVSQKADTKALLGVEFDGPYHHSDQGAQRRDALKDSICEKLGMPLLRIDSDFINQKLGRFQLLSYFVDIWFLSEAFHEQQAEGYIPKDEIFDPYSVIKIEKDKIKREFDPAQEAKDFLYSISKRRSIKPYPPIILNGTDRSERYSVCLAMVFVKDGTILATGCFKNIRLWPVLPSDIAEDIAFIGLAKKVYAYKEGQITAYNFEKVASEFYRWKYPIEWKVFKDEKGFPCFQYKHTPNTKK